MLLFKQLKGENILLSVIRICELLTKPNKHYKRTDKFMRALEKNLLVVSTVESRRRDPSPETTNMDNKSAALIYMNGNHNGAATAEGNGNSTNHGNGEDEEEDAEVSM